LANVWLLFGVLRTLTASAALACLGATLWGTSPLNLGSLGWYAAFGHVLVGTTLLLVLRLVIQNGAGGPVRARTATASRALLLGGAGRRRGGWPLGRPVRHDRGRPGALVRRPWDDADGGRDRGPLPLRRPGAAGGGPLPGAAPARSIGGAASRARGPRARGRR